MPVVSPSARLGDDLERGMRQPIYGYLVGRIMRLQSVSISKSFRAARRVTGCGPGRSPSLSRQTWDFRGPDHYSAGMVARTKYGTLRLDRPSGYLSIEMPTGEVSRVNRGPTHRDDHIETGKRHCRYQTTLHSPWDRDISLSRDPL